MRCIIGIPNAGKTTYSQRFDNVYHIDDFGKQRWEKIKSIISDDVTFDGLFIHVNSRRRLLSLCDDNYTKTCIWLATPLNDCLQRENRGRLPGLVHHYYNTFQIPTYSEGWDEIIKVVDGKEIVLSKEEEDDYNVRRNNYTNRPAQWRNLRHTRPHRERHEHRRNV